MEISGIIRIVRTPADPPAPVDKKRRLAILELQTRMAGIYVPPHVQYEIEGLRRELAESQEADPPS